MMRKSLYWSGVRWLSASVISVSLIACGDDTSSRDTAGGSDGITTASGTDSGTGGTDSVGTDGDPTSDSNSESDSDTTTGASATGPGTSGGTDTDATATAADTGSTTATDDPALLYLVVDPPNTVLEVDLGQVAMQSFTVEAVFDNGSDLDVTNDVTWTVENPAVGTMAGNTFTTDAKNAVFFDNTLVTADYMGETGQAQITLAAYQQSGAEPDFFFVLPHEDPNGSQSKELTFTTDIKALDVFFNMDTTGSMDQEIVNLQDALTSTVIPGIQAQVPDSWFGAGAYEDFPVSPFGEENCYYGAVPGPDQPFELFSEMTGDVVAVQAAVNGLAIGGEAIGCGNDGPESHLEALYQIATGEGLAGPGLTAVPSNNNGVGGVAFRDGSFPIIISVTDAVTQDPDSTACNSAYPTNATVSAVAHGWDETFAALGNICARVATVATNTSTGCGPIADGTALAEGTGAVIPPEAWDLAPGGRPAGCAANQCCTGSNGNGVAANGQGLCPMVYRASFDGTGVSQAIVDGIQMTAAYSSFTVTTEVTGETTDTDGNPTPAGTTTADFIISVTPFGHGPVPLPGVPDPTMTATSFENVIPNTDVTFTIEAYNDFVPQGPEPRLFIAHIAVLADACSDLDERDVLILVPPADLPDPG